MFMTAKNRPGLIAKVMIQLNSYNIVGRENLTIRIALLRKASIRWTYQTV